MSELDVANYIADSEAWDKSLPSERVDNTALLAALANPPSKEECPICNCLIDLDRYLCADCQALYCVECGKETDGDPFGMDGMCRECLKKDKKSRKSS
jgi:predicted nucleic acid-binding Zn ribbon protein